MVNILTKTHGKLETSIVSAPDNQFLQKFTPFIFKAFEQVVSTVDFVCLGNFRK